jgi:thiol:disulfide interchange protein
MKALCFVSKRYVQAFALMFAILLLVYIGRGQQIAQAVQEAALWSGIAALVFACTVVYNRISNKPCKVCRDNPD